MVARSGVIEHLLDDLYTRLSLMPCPFSLVDFFQNAETMGMRERLGDAGLCVENLLLWRLDDARTVLWYFHSIILLSNILSLLG